MFSWKLAGEKKSIAVLRQTHGLAILAEHGRKGAVHRDKALLFIFGVLQQNRTALKINIANANLEQLSNPKTAAVKHPQDHRKFHPKQNIGVWPFWRGKCVSGGEYPLYFILGEDIRDVGFRHFGNPWDKYRNAAVLQIFQKIPQVSHLVGNSFPCVGGKQALNPVALGTASA